MHNVQQSRLKVTTSCRFHKASLRFCSKLNHIYCRMNKQLNFIQVFVSLFDGFAESAYVDSLCLLVCMESILNPNWRKICILMFTQGNYSRITVYSSRHLAYEAYILNINGFQGPLKPVDTPVLSGQPFMLWLSHLLTHMRVYFCKYISSYIVQHLKW